jgi:hypothetical protein
LHELLAAAAVLAAAASKVHGSRLDPDFAVDRSNTPSVAASTSHCASRIARTDAYVADPAQTSNSA